MIVLLIVVADQVSKIWIKTHFANGDDVRVIGDWFRLHFIENEGMAYGMKLSESPIGKIVLSSFRLVAVIFGFYLLKRLIEKGYGRGMLICGALILAGAMGNLLDSMFYGLIFSESPYSCFSGNYDSMQHLLQNHNREAVAHFTQFGKGYGSFLQGRVVDMFYFPIIETTLPRWVPFWGGRNFVFFEPVFNLADAAISIGIITLLLFQKKLMHHTGMPQQDAVATNNDTNATVSS
ncbi:lipoprotein signal peptidase [Nemorincola caseinilytica]|uniref:Lipoprotein signal peptidase n=1 Tax=Nemorincola caseinilytica TaxID=2054315 RepID=A0ABP8NCC0_9BACT